MFPLFFSLYIPGLPQLFSFFCSSPAFVTGGSLNGPYGPPHSPPRISAAGRNTAAAGAARRPLPFN